MAPHPTPEVALDLALALVASSTAPVLLLDKDLAIVAASASFCNAFQIDPAGTRDCAFANLGEAGEWNAPQLSGLLKATASGFAEVGNYELNLVREGLETRRLIVNAKRLRYAGEGDIRGRSVDC